MGDNKIKRQESKIPVARGGVQSNIVVEPGGAGNDIERHSLARKPLTPDERPTRIADAAYRIAERRGFAPGSELDDWLEAERELDADETTGPPRSD